MQSISFFFILIISLIASAGCSPNYKTILNNYITSHNSHDINKTLSFYSDDISFELVGAWKKNGKDKIRKLEEWDAATNSALNFRVLRENGDTLFCNGEEKNDWFSAVGITSVSYKSIAFIFDDSLIKKIIAEPHEEINMEVGKAMSSIMKFTARTNNNVISELLPNGEFIYSKESAEKWKILLEEWNEYKSQLEE